jgi:allophanate hydrolase subunit 2
VVRAEFINLGGDDTPLEGRHEPLTIEASTPLCLLQDAGRFGVRHLGVTQGGGLDWRSMSGPTGCWATGWMRRWSKSPWRVHRGGRTGLRAGAGRGRPGAQVDDEALAPWRSFRLHKGQRLQFTQPLLGARAYLAAPGGFDAPKVLGSSATVVREALGGLDGMGRPLGKDDCSVIRVTR